MNNLALFATHNIFLTENEISKVVGGEEIRVVGCCVPVWVNAKTGKTTEPASEIFCDYVVVPGEDGGNVEFIPRRGFKIMLPKTDWSGPDEVEYEEVAKMTSAERAALMKIRDKWWFNNPRPQDIDNLRRGYLRFEVKRLKEKNSRGSYSVQHVVEVASMDRLVGSLTV